MLEAGCGAIAGQFDGKDGKTPPKCHSIITAAPETCQGQFYRFGHALRARSITDVGKGAQSPAADSTLAPRYPPAQLNL
jgi:hypothetical protein